MAEGVAVGDVLLPAAGLPVAVLLGEVFAIEMHERSLLPKQPSADTRKAFKLNALTLISNYCYLSLTAYHF